MMEYRILLLEDDESFGYILSEYLGMQDFEIQWVKSGEEALDALLEKSFHLAILDVMLPGIDGYEVAQRIKYKYPQLPFIFLSAKSLKIDALKGFKSGAYDFINKPVDEEILVAKINAILKQTVSSKQQADIIQLGQYIFKPRESRLIYEEDIIKLTARESELLNLLFLHKNKLLSRKKALSELWSNTDEFSRKSMDVFISHLRKYLSRDKNIIIENVHGKGFILKC